MIWKFFRRDLDDFEVCAYESRLGCGILEGFARINEGMIFINLPVIKSFEQLYSVIEHEFLHNIAECRDEHIIRGMVEW